MAKKASHAEIWDDSALVTSWNEALAEYKVFPSLQHKYHSLAARGEKIEVVLDAAENGELDAGEDAVPGGDLPVDHAPEIHATTTTTNGVAPAPTAPPTARQDAPPAAAAAGASPAAIPQLLLNQGEQSPPTTSYGIGSDCANKSFAVQDEPLKNVMMSWYYAGYYTGLYEGQQKAFAGTQQPGG
ncbi:hypothetical protein LTR12_012614 [Friedmanniomyces endolithicus]|nr:hypothetical protein LTR12_012614 [Friedmanniomyces endolithicus]